MKAFAVTKFVATTSSPLSSCCKASVRINDNINTEDFPEPAPEHYIEKYCPHHTSLSNDPDDCTYVCSKCGNELYLLTTGREQRLWTNIEYVEKGDLEDTKYMIRAGHISMFYFLAKNKKKGGWHVAALDIEHRVTFNAMTGNLYILDLRGRHKNVKSPTGGMRMKNISHFADTIRSVLTREQCVEFVDMCIAERKKYLATELHPLIDEIERYVEEKRAKKSAYYYKDTFIFLKFPALVNLPIKTIKDRYGFRVSQNRRFRNKLVNETKGTKLLNSVLGVGNGIRKKIIKIADETDKESKYLTAAIASRMFPADWVPELVKKRTLFIDNSLFDITTKTSKILKKFSESYGQRRLYNHLNVKDVGYYFSDVIRMYEQLVYDNPDYTVPKASTFKKVHDLLAKDHRRIKDKLSEFSYSDKTLELQGEYGGYSFELPVSNHELADLGSDMCNCVSSYADRVLKHKILIFAGRLNGENVMCIEIVNNKVVQAKLKHNKGIASTIALKEYCAMIEFCEVNEFEYNKCKDMDVDYYKRIAEHANNNNGNVFDIIDNNVDVVEEVPF